MEHLVSIAVHLVHVLTLIGCGVMLAERQLLEAFKVAIVGAICVIVLAASHGVAGMLVKGGF